MLRSTISWLDFSESERRKTIEVIALFQDRETRDELGVGSIRDGFANDFFPGTTTLQTRARYFLLIPWIYRTYEKKFVGSGKIRDRLRWDETNLIEILKKADEHGVIGQRSGVGLQRFPSSIYWIGMQEWGICRFPGTQDQYHRSLNHWHKYQKHRAQTEEEQPNQEAGLNWDPNLPKPPDGFLTATNLSLTLEEAEYLRECLRLNCTDSLLSYLAENTQPVDDSVQFPWLHPQMSEFPKVLQEKLAHAQNFSEALFGAALLYNYLLANKIKNASLTEQYHQDLVEWQKQLTIRTAYWKRWDQGAFWRLAKSIGNVPLGTERFVNQWLSLLFEDGKIAKPENKQSMHALIEERERRLKGSRSRFASQRHLEIWNGAASAGQIEYRWRVARRILTDVLNGLHKNGGPKNAGT